MKKMLRFSVLLFVTVMLLAAVMAVSASAEDVAYYYIDSENGTDRGFGNTPSAPLRTFTEACKNAVRDGVEKAYIVVMNEYVFNGNVKEVEHPDVEFVLTSRDSVTDYGSRGAKLIITGARRYYLNGNTTFENLKIERDSSFVVVAQYNHLTFGEGLTMTYTSETDSGFWVVGGYQSPEDSVEVSLDSHITIKSGTYHRVVGGSRQNWNSKYEGLTYTGTHYIDISGGKIDILICASYAKNVSDSAVVNISGGEFRQIYLGGDDTRRFNNDVTANFTGGKVTENIFVNNIVGEVNLTIAGTEMSSLALSYKTDKIKEMAKEKNKTKNLYYDSHYYTEAQIEAFCVGFDKVENITSVYTANGAKGSGKSEDDPAAFADAFKSAVETEAVLIVLEDMTVTDITEPAHDATITVKGVNETVTLTVKGTYTLGGETVFSDIRLAGDGRFNAENGMLTVAADATVRAKCDITGSATLCAGEFGNITNANTVIVNGAAVQNITGGHTSANIEVLAGKVGQIVTSANAIENFALVVSGGAIDKITFRNVTKELSYKLYGGTVAAYEVGGANVKGTLQLGDGISADTLGAAASLFETENSRVVYLADGGSGRGATPSAPVGSLQDAYAAIGNADGTIVICGKTTLSEAFTDVKNPGKITITSVWGGVDYRDAGASLTFCVNFYCGGDTEFRDITLRAKGSYLSIFGGNYDLTLGEGIVCEKVESYQYPSVMGGSRNVYRDAASHLTIESGTWQRVRGGTAASGSQNYKVNLTITGGTFIERLTLGDSGSHNGNILAIIRGGTFYQGIYAATLSSATESFSGKVDLRLEGGVFYNRIAPAASTTGNYSGSFNVTITGGNFAHLVELRGAEGLSGGMTSTISSSVDLSAEETGTYTFQNHVRNDGADPWLFYHDGYYYYTSTTGNSALKLVRVANIGDLIYSGGTTIYDPAPGQPYSDSSWSPEIHHYTDEEIGEGNGGWYCYLAGTSADTIGEGTSTGEHRMYVIKCLDGDNLLGRWGNPITGEVNVPQLVDAPDIPNFYDTWAAGMTDIRINGKLYTMYVTVVDDGGGVRHQTINIVKMTNPWTIRGESKVICEPEYDWERGNHKKLFIVECGTAVYAEDGSIFIVYSACGYSTPQYKLGQLKYLGGDPTEKSSWEKAPYSILSMSDQICGIGSACYVTDTAGQGWICYNAYLGTTASGARRAFVEPYTADATNGVVIGDGSRHPADILTVYEVPVNPLPLEKKISGFDTVDDSKARRTVVKLTIGKAIGTVNGVEQELDAAPIIANSRTMLPVRFLAEAFGAKVDWDGVTSTATITADGVKIAITIGAATAQINGGAVELDSPAFIENSRTYLPVRVIADALGAAVEWDGATSTATLTK